MNRLALILTTLVISGSGLRAASTPEDNAQLIDLLKNRLVSLETRVSQLEEALAAQSTPLPPKSQPADTSKSDQPKPAPAPEPEKKVAEKTDAPKTDAPKKERKTYVISEGDTISIIAKKHNLPREELMKTNGLREGQQIYIGDSLIIPDPPKGGSIAKSETKKDAKDKPSPAGSGGAVYTVRGGDTLTRIAKKHSITVPALKSANNLKTDLISIGQKLKIPGKSPSPNTVAKNTTTTTTKPETPKKESAGDAGVPPNTGEFLEGESYGLYTVESGDTLYSLARDFFTSPAEIQRLNKLGGSNTIHPGQDLVVPTSKYYEKHELANN